MSMTVETLYQLLDERIPASLSCSWDHDGLMCCPDPKREVRRVLLTLDVTEEAVDEAVKKGCEVILSHHPLIFDPLPSLTSPKLIKLIQNNIAVMSFHTRLDAVQHGVNDTLAACLGLIDCRPLAEDSIGVIGSLPEEMALDDFLDSVKSALGVDTLQYTKGNGPCRRVAVVGGGGKDLFPEVLASDADTFLTGDLNYSAMMGYRESGLHLIAAGHYETENPVLATLAQWVREWDATIECRPFACRRILFR